MHCQGVGCTPWRPSGSGRRETMWSAKGSDVRPGVPRAPPLCVAGVGQCALSRGRMYALGFGWRPWVSASFVWQAWDNVHFCVAGMGQCALPRGRMYALGFGWRPWVSASFAWQAWDNVHCQGVGCTPWGSSGVLGSPPFLRGRRGAMFTAGGFCVAGVGHCAHTHSHSLTHSHAFSFTHLCMHIHTHIHKNSPTITPPSLLYFLFPSCFSMLSLSLEKLVTCGVIRSYNCWLISPQNVGVGMCWGCHLRLNPHETPRHSPVTHGVCCSVTFDGQNHCGTAGQNQPWLVTCFCFQLALNKSSLRVQITKITGENFWLLPNLSRSRCCSDHHACGNAKTSGRCFCAAFLALVLFLHGCLQKLQSMTHVTTRGR